MNGSRSTQGRNWHKRCKCFRSSCLSWGSNYVKMDLSAHNQHIVIFRWSKNPTWSLSEERVPGVVRYGQVSLESSRRTSSKQSVGGTNLRYGSPAVNHRCQTCWSGQCTPTIVRASKMLLMLHALLASPILIALHELPIASLKSVRRSPPQGSQIGHVAHQEWQRLFPQKWALMSFLKESFTVRSQIKTPFEHHLWDQVS